MAGTGSETGAGAGVRATRRRGAGRRAGTGGRPGLTPDRIVDGCIALLDEQGPDALTFRRIGAWLGVDPTAVYRHFRDKDELVLAVADRLIARSLEDFTPSEHWRDTLRDMLVRSRTVYLAHPEAAVLSAARTTRRPAEMAAVEILLGTLADAGFPPDEAVKHYRALVDFVLAWAGFEAQYLTLDQAARSGDEAAWAREYAGAPADRYPHIAAAADHLPTVTAQDNFAHALDLLLDSVEARAAEYGGPPE